MHSLCLLSGRGPSEVIEPDSKPPVDGIVDLKVLVADLLGRKILRNRLRLGSCSVLIRTAHVQRDMTTETRVPGKYISREDTPDDISQVRYIIHVRQG